VVAWRNESVALRVVTATTMIAVSLVFCSPLLQRRGATVAAAEVREGSVLVLLAGAADAPRRLAALHALCTETARTPGTRGIPVLVGDDDELDDDSGRAWGPVLVDRIRVADAGCLEPRLVPGRVRTTGEELDALARVLDGDAGLDGRPLVFVTSPYHRARVDAGAGSRPPLASRDRRFLEVPLTCDDVAPHTVLFEGARLARDALGLSELLGRRTVDALRERTPWARPHGRR
jgi:hypothetical protein